MRSRAAVLTVVWAAILLLAKPGSGATTEPAIDVRQLEAHIIDARRQVTSGEFRIGIKSDHPDAWRVSYHIWFDGPADVRQEVQIDDNLDVCTNVCILNGTVGIYYSGRPGAYTNPNLLKRSAIWMVPVAEARRDASPFLVCDPRMAMMVPLQVGLWPRYHPDSLVAGPGRANLAARASAWNGLASVIVSFTHPKTGNTYEYEVVPGRTYNICRWRMAGTLPGRKAAIPFEDTLDCDLAQVTEGLWLPHQIRRIVKRNGDTKTDETTTVEALGANGAVDPVRFTLAGGGLPPKQLIIQSLPPGSEPRPAAAGPNAAPAAKPRFRPPLWWDGKEVRPLTAAVEAERIQSQSAAEPPAK